jgi:hypothetical protein
MQINRLSGPVAAVAGLLLAFVVLLQASYLNTVATSMHLDGIRAEASGMNRALRWRFQNDISVRDHNTVTMVQALNELAADSDSLQWSWVYEADNASGAPVAVASSIDAGKLSPAEIILLQNIDIANQLPLLHGRDDGLLLAVDSIQVAERKLLICLAFSPDSPEYVGRYDYIVQLVVVAGIAAAVLLVLRGCLDFFRC